MRLYLPGILLVLLIVRIHGGFLGGGLTTLGDSCHPILSQYFYCESSKTNISILCVCDGVRDCVKPNDEKDQFCESLDCPEDYVRCEGGRCIRDVKLCDDVDDCIPPGFRIPAWDEDQIRCPNPCKWDNPCRNGATCEYIKDNDTYVCECTKHFTGVNCTDLKEEEKGFDAVTIGVVSAVGGAAVANTACVAYSKAQEAKQRAASIKGKVSKGLKTSRQVSTVHEKGAQVSNSRAAIAAVKKHKQKDVEAQHGAKAASKVAKHAKKVKK